MILKTVSFDLSIKVHNIFQNEIKVYEINYERTEIIGSARKTFFDALQYALLVLQK